MKYMIPLLLLSLSLPGQDLYLFDAVIIERTSDSTAVFSVKVPDWSRSYADFDLVEQTAVLFDTAYHGDRYLLQYDSIVTAYPKNDHEFTTMCYPAELNTRYRVYDGDGYWAKVRVPIWSDCIHGKWETITRKFRGYKFDTYEIRPRKYYKDGTRKTKEEITREKELARRARDLSAALLRDFCFAVEFKEKYRNNRWVATTWFIDGPYEGMKMKTYLTRGGMTSGYYE